MGVVLGIIIMFFQRRENGGISAGRLGRSVRGEFGVRGFLKMKRGLDSSEHPIVKAEQNL